MKHGWFVAISTIAGLALGSSASAQLTNVPVFVNPSVGTVYLAGDFSTGVNDESGKNNALAARASLGLGPIVLGAGIALVDYDLFGKESTYMGSLGFRLISAGMIKVMLQAGVGFQQFGDESFIEDIKTADVPIALGFGLDLGIVQPWLAPRYTIQRVTAGAEIENRNHFGASFGLDVNLIAGLGAQAALDWRSLPAIGDPGDFLVDLKRQPVLVSVGAHWGF